jgi:hypothetical protein
MESRLSLLVMRIQVAKWNSVYINWGSGTEQSSGENHDDDDTG